MKKVFIIFLLLFISFSLFAYESKTDYVYVKGFFAESETSLIFKVWKEDSVLTADRIYHAGRVDVSGLEQEEVKVFNWELSGNRAMTVSITFTITPLQAFSNGTYFIPKHTVKMYDEDTSQSHAFSTAQTGSSSYPGYRQSTSGAGVFVINSAEFTFTESVTSSTTKTGHCTIQVFNYDNVTAGNFDYVSYVTVEFSTQ